MAAFFAQQFAAPQPAAPKPGENDPEAYRPKLEFVENPFGEGIKQPPGLPHLYRLTTDYLILDMYAIPEKKPRLHY